MTSVTSIEWADSTFNPWMGCTKVSPACDHCYAEALVDRRLHRAEWGAGKPRVRTSAANWRLPEKCNRALFVECGSCGWREDGLLNVPDGGCPSCMSWNIQPARRRVFCASLADVFDNEVPLAWLVDLLDLIRRTPNLDWLLLTKRIGNWRGRVTAAIQYIETDRWGDNQALQTRVWLRDWLGSKAPANVWMGATICNQHEADRDIPKLVATPAAVRFLSMEPLLEAVDLTPAYLPCPSARDGLHMDWSTGAYECCRRCDFTGIGDEMGIDWVIAGGESGAGARPTHPGWVRNLRDQCTAAGVPFLFKQWGEWGPYDRGRIDGAILATPYSSDQPLQRFGKKVAGRLLDGREWNQFPEARP